MSKAMVKKLLSIKSFDDVIKMQRRKTYFFEKHIASRHPNGINNITFW